MRRSTHIVPKAKSGWNVKKGGSKKASKHFETKKEAEKWGREQSRKDKSEPVKHNKDGKISSSDSHGNDPNPPKE